MHLALLPRTFTRLRKISGVYHQALTDNRIEEVFSHRADKMLLDAQTYNKKRSKGAKSQRDRDHSEPDDNSESQVDEPKEARRPKKKT